LGIFVGVECFELTPGPTAPTFRFSAYEADDADSAFFCDGFRCRGASEGLPEGATDDPKGSTLSAAPGGGRWSLILLLVSRNNLEGFRI